MLAQLLQLHAASTAVLLLLLLLHMLLHCSFSAYCINFGQPLPWQVRVSKSRLMLADPARDKDTNHMQHSSMLQGM
jgi:hypothetical protein